MIKKKLSFKDQNTRTMCVKLEQNFFLEYTSMSRKLPKTPKTMAIPSTYKFIVRDNSNQYFEYSSIFISANGEVKFSEIILL